MLRILDEIVPFTTGDADLDAAILATVVEDEMDAPADWDSGAITFDPYL